MRVPVSYAALGPALGLALAATASAAHAQTIITPTVDQPVVTVPAATVQTTETVRTIRPAPRNAHRQIVTTRTITRRVVPATTAVVAGTVPAAPQPLYDEVTSPTIAAEPQPLYDEVSAPMAATVAAPAGAEPYSYRYVYEPDRILVIDPATGIAIQSIPR